MAAGTCLLFRTRRSKHFLVRGAGHSEPMASLDRDNRIHYFCHIRGDVYWIDDGGWFSDRVGRKRALIFTTIWYAAFSLINAFVWGTGCTLFLARLLTGLGLSALTVVGMTYISEMFPATRRGAYQAWILMIALFGIPVTAYVARFCVPMAVWGWRLVFLWGSLGILFPLFAGRIGGIAAVVRESRSARRSGCRPRPHREICRERNRLSAVHARLGAKRIVAALDTPSLSHQHTSPAP